MEQDRVNTENDDFYNGFQHKQKKVFFADKKMEKRKKETVKSHNHESVSKREEHEAARDRAKEFMADAYLLSEKVIRYTKPIEGNQAEKQELINMTTSPQLFAVVEVSRVCAVEASHEKEVGDIIEEVKPKAAEAFMIAEDSASNREVLRSLGGQEEKDREEGLLDFQAHLVTNEDKLKDKLNRSDTVLGNKVVDTALQQKPSTSEEFHLKELIEQQELEQIIIEEAKVAKVTQEVQEAQEVIEQNLLASKIKLLPPEQKNLLEQVGPDFAEEKREKNEFVIPDSGVSSVKEMENQRRVVLVSMKLRENASGHDVNEDLKYPEIDADSTLKRWMKAAIDVKDKNVLGEEKSEQFEELMTVVEEIKPKVKDIVKNESVGNYKKVNFEKNMLISAFTQLLSMINLGLGIKKGHLVAEDKGVSKSFVGGMTGMSHLASTVGLGVNMLGLYNSFQATRKTVSNKDASISNVIMTGMGLGQSAGATLNSAANVVNLVLGNGTLSTVTTYGGGTLAVTGGMLDVANGSLTIHGARKTAGSIKEQMDEIEKNHQNDYGDLKNVMEQARKNTTLQKVEGSAKIVTGFIKSAALDPTVGKFVGVAASLLATMAELGVNYFRKRNIRGFAELLVPWKTIRDKVKSEKKENGNPFPIATLSDRDYRQKTLLFAGSATGELEESGLRGIQSIITALRPTESAKEGYERENMLRAALGVSEKATEAELGLKLGLTKTMAGNLTGAIALRVERHEKNKKRGAFGYLKNRHFANVGQFFRQCGAG